MNREAISESRGTTYGIGDLANTFFRHKKKALAFSLGVLALATLIILFAPRKYRSEARLFLQVGRESIRLDPSATTGKTIALQQAGRDSEVATAIEVLHGRAILEKAVDRLTPEVVLGQAGSAQAEPNPVADAVMMPLRKLVAAVKSIDPISKREEAVIEMERNFEVDAEHDSTVLALTYDAETAALAQQILQTIVSVYQDEHVRLHQTSGSKPFFTKQRDELEQQLVAAEQALRAAKNRMGVGSIESRRSTLEQRLASVEQSRNGVIQAKAAAEARIKALKGHIDEMPERMHTQTSQVPNTGADALRSQLYTLQVELMNLEAKYNADHPYVTAKRSQVDEAKKMLSGESDLREVSVDSVNENQRALELDLAKAESELAGNEAQMAEIDSQRATSLADLKKLNDYEVEIADLERAATLARNNFYGYADDVEKVRVDEELDLKGITNVAVAQDATLGEKPISPSKLLVCALSLLMATAGTTALVLASERFDSRLRSEDQAEQVLRLPVLASVPEGALTQRRRDGKYWRQFDSLFRTCESQPMNKSIKVKGAAVEQDPEQDEPLSPHAPATPRIASRELGTAARRPGAEPYDGLLWRLQARQTPENTRTTTLGLIGCERRVGVTTVAANLAIRASELMLGPVMLVEATTGGAKLSKLWRLRPGPGLAQLLSGEASYADCVQPGPAAGLSVLPAGPLARGEVGLLEPGAVDALLAEACADHRLVIFDLPAAEQMQQMVLLARQLDQALLVVRSDATRERTAQRVADRLIEDGVPLSGAVLNRQRTHVPRWLMRWM